MKKTAILFILTAIIACNKNTNQETKNNKILWAENVQSIVPLVKDSSWNEADWNAVYKYDKEKIFSSITHAVLSGKLKAYADYPNKEITVTGFNNILVKWDSTNVVADPKHPGYMISAPIKKELKSGDITEIKFNEKIELDTLSYSLSNNVSYITFFTYKYNEIGEILGIKKLFDVKLNALSINQKEK